MRLKLIKLAGFKSFVDPTSVPFPGNMSAVVGPNGCGKSNIIDAVRWVMGESSAKNLRGEAMTDVIFNGSVSRKPIGQASIELLFDNSDSTLKGEYAAFSDISVRRKVTRDGQSAYYINGTKCRRRDVTGLFLGTGLGPRSYAIIEQGTISRLIESKPEELRIFLEEAAGISKYKERRRETESRIRRTQENMERLTDICEELERQLSHLDKQARSAERYSELKRQERQAKAQLQALHWKENTDLIAGMQLQVDQNETNLEKLLFERTRNETVYEQLREAQQFKRDAFDEIQNRFYASRTEVARLEQRLQHQKESAVRLEHENLELLQNTKEAECEFEREKNLLDEINEQLDELNPELETMQLVSEESVEKLMDTESAMSSWQQDWDQFSDQFSRVSRQSDLDQNRIQNLENQIQKWVQREQKLYADLEVIERSRVEGNEIAKIQSLLDQFAEQKEISEEAVHQALFDKDQAETELTQMQLQRDTFQGLLHKHQGELSSLTALQKAARADEDSELFSWFSQNNDENISVLMDQLSIETGWETAVEVVLADSLKALRVEHYEALAQKFYASGKSLPLMLYCHHSVELKNKNTTPITLMDKVRGAEAFSDLLVNIVCMVPPSGDRIKWAFEQLQSLQAGQSLVTPDGFWLSQHWIKFPAKSHPGSGYLHRKEALLTLDIKIAEVQLQLEETERSIESKKKRVQGFQNLLSELQSKINLATREEAQLYSKMTAHKVASGQLEHRHQQCLQDIKETVQAKEHDIEALSQINERWQRILSEVQLFSSEKEALLLRRDEVRARLDEYRLRSRQDREQVHHLLMQKQNVENSRKNTQQSLDRIQVRQKGLQARSLLLTESLNSTFVPVEELTEKLEQLLNQQIQDERKCADARQLLESIDEKIRQAEVNRHQIEQQIQTQRANLETCRMEVQALSIKCHGLRDSLTEEGWDLSAVLSTLTETLTVAQCEQMLIGFDLKIKKLGAINLAAVDEYRLHNERKCYLDGQYEDLSEALDTLESAIRKIDRETRTRFKETFDKVNLGLQALFPKVFGGGSACLALTGDDLLETGVSIMAQPPGKKNATIHLLSGGEKALVAIALVFAIFQLNPAPFCMLDEVDAPLDDANVERYVKMVKEMSLQVQFIYITHNKIAMEMADHLMGVTMHEPGVSRLVSVDVEAAAALLDG